MSEALRNEKGTNEQKDPATSPDAQEPFLSAENTMEGSSLQQMIDEVPPYHNNDHGTGINVCRELSKRQILQSGGHNPSGDTKVCSM